MTGSDFKVVFISPLYNAADNLPALCNSLQSQTDHDAWRHVIIDDMSSDGPEIQIANINAARTHVTPHMIWRNSEKKYALRNIVETARVYQNEPNTIIATVDGDDQLCNNNTVALLRKAYESGADVVWTAHRWDTNGMNISREMPTNVNPYVWPWCSSHLRTFRASLLKGISDRNFQDHNGTWFKRGYDQALMLPLLHQTRRRLYLPDVCYLYRIDSKSIPAAERNYCEKAQLSTVNLVRARGFLK